ncbi:MAG: hypothetical protein A2508_03105 [Candidatus Lambdaproteobacteria bacterium RIFOXYD12_FULL_49_8]|uniref:SiaC family regulatory phosphoprotein domain-containing protein n=1 Tax=Candidatus Lambdaproteobacteria bacterium RIFOXYD2_FULL_50_16 TaxID=1817772 RepID=A0A1F6GA83_9PROT|nr:MAG: hypothetical protein A3K03_01350 [Bdellovibrionales bacterium RIFOXYD1_FULL_44_7]OGG95022.1 MAG: hypothetical protein A2527_12680 [Candidatus Lambdaproteobacteria bacterium RIFOXYD2_FULL_50_16]OGG98287.1 MAG: hypothetical protein A2508_03105 [Candidatus Lambdaproteobacteria bacterium RIFOXYD12_FULL_49_8]
MNLFLIESSETTPQIRFDEEAHYLEIIGESYPENTAKFYNPLFDRITQYLATPGGKKLAVDLLLAYFNSSSLKVFMNLFDLLNEAAKKGAAIEVNWYFEAGNDLSQEYGLEFKEDLDALRFSVLQKEG